MSSGHEPLKPRVASGAGPVPPALDRRNLLVAGGASLTVLAAGAADAGEDAPSRADGQVRMTVIYPRPTDEARFLDYYLGTHAPLAQRIPGLVDTRIAVVEQRLSGEIDAFLIVDLDFAADRFEAAMQSEEMAAANRDVANFAEAAPIVLLSSPAAR